MTATKTTTRKAPAKAQAPAPATKAVTAPAKRSHRQLVTDAMATWQHENQQALTLVAHLSGTATAGSIWKVRTEAGEERRARFATVDGKLRLVGFDENGAGRTTKEQVVSEVSKLGQYTVIQHSTGSVWTVQDTAGKQWLFDRKAGTLAEKPEKKAPAAKTEEATK